MIPVNFDAIQEFLKEKNVNSEMQKETNQLVIKLTLAQKEFPLFIRIYEGSEMVQLLAFLPIQIKPAAMAGTARLLNFLNKELDIPGFGMDEDVEVVFFRAMIPVKDKQLETVFLMGFLNAVQLACHTFVQVIAAVASGSTSFADVVKMAKERKKTTAAKQ